jgi:hypothetical protein
MKEIWKDVITHLRIYQISDGGQVRRIKPEQGTKCKVLKPTANKVGYLYVSLSSKCKSRRVFVHVLVAESFIGPKPSPKHVVNHKDGIKNNNKLCNLEWVTKSEDCLHKHRVLGKSTGSNHHNYGRFGINHNRSKKYIVTTPDGTEIEVIGLRHFCKENNLEVSAMCHLCISTRRRTHRGGWKCRFG